MHVSKPMKKVLDVLGAVWFSLSEKVNRECRDLQESPTFPLLGLRPKGGAGPFQASSIYITGSSILRRKMCSSALGNAACLRCLTSSKSGAGRQLR